MAHDLVQALTPRFESLRETHISWVFLGEDEVYKLKKPVLLPYLDFSTLEKRRAACEAEVRLNARLSPDVYVGVEPVTRDAASNLVLGGPGEVVEWAVHMRRLPDAWRGDVLLAKHALTAEHVEDLASTIADFHALSEVEPDASGPGSVSVLRAHAQDNLTALRERLDQRLGAAGAQELARVHLGELDRLAPLLDVRRREGRVRDGHGDLRLDHAYFAPDGRVRVLDCVEFDRAFRVADVCADVAFFAMSLRLHGRDDLAERFVARYARDAGDHDLYALLRFYETYWALVRAKVAATRRSELVEERRDAPWAEVDALLTLAVELARTQRPGARIIAVGGMIACGKSRLSERIGAALQAPVLQSDRLRKQLASAPLGASLGSDAFAGAYSEQASAALYAELVRRARVVLESGRPVVIDASLRTRAHRDACRALAEELGVRLDLVECCAPRHVIEARLAERQAGQTISDARLSLLDEFAAHYEPPTGDENVLRIDTSGERDETWARARDALGLETITAR